MGQRLYHFSDDPAIQIFEPRPVRVPAPRRAGMEWLNGPLVWAIDEAHSPLYLFPRECPRIVFWRKPDSPARDVERFLDPKSRMTAYVETGWTERIKDASLIRYVLPAETFVDLEDAGMHVTRGRVVPLSVERLDDLPRRLADRNVVLRHVVSLTPAPSDVGLDPSRQRYPLAKRCRLAGRRGSDLIPRSSRAQV